VVAIVQDAAAKAGHDARMKSFTPITIGRGSAQPPLRAQAAIGLAVAWLRTRWQRAQLSDETCYLANATDHADLERRLRALERCASQPPL
jgi:hypothetical protein